MDLQRIDHNLQALRAIEGSWSNLPPIPDEVKLDLAGNALVTPAALGVLFNGLAADIEEAEKPQPLPTRNEWGYGEPVDPSYGYKPPTNPGAVVASVAGLPQPQVYAVDAPQRLKRRLKDEGYLNLSDEEIMNPQWLPEYSYAAGRMNFDEMTAQFQGNKPGSLSVDQVMGFVDEWLSPRGLYRAAVELDLWWDAGNISEDFQKWDEKLEAWREDPFDVRKLIDLTGPLDDILFPVLNWGLMFVGVGELVAVGRGLKVGVQGASKLAGLYRGSKGLNFAAAAADDVTKAALRASDDIARFSQPSFLSSKLSGPLPQASKAMDAWRSRGGVVLAKKANQQVMRMGFASNLEDLIDADQGDYTIDRFTNGKASEAINNVFTNPAVDWGVDLLLTPANIWNPGTFAKPGKAAIDAARGGFLKAANNENLLSAYHRPVLASITETEGEAAAKAFEKTIGKVGFKRALQDKYFGGDEERMGGALGFIATMGAIEYASRQIVDGMAGGMPDWSAKGETLFRQIRNQNIARLRQLDPNNIEDLLTHIAKYGDLGDTFQKGHRRATIFERNYRRVRDGYLESAETAAARGEAVATGHTRFIGSFNSDLGRMEWRPARAGDMFEDDPFFVDVLDSELTETLENAGDVLSGAAPLPDEFANRYLRRDAAGHLRHNRLSEAGRVRLFDPEKLAKLKALAARHNELRNEYMTEMMNGLPADALEQYIYEVMPTLGNWDNFVQSSGIIREAEIAGALANAQFVTPMSQSNRALSAMPWTPGSEKWTNELFSVMLELPDDEKLTGSLMRSVFAPFARQVDPQMGNFTAAAADTVTKQQALGFAATARRSTRMVKAIRKLKALPRYQEIVRTAQNYLESTDSIHKAGLREAMAEVLGSKAVSEDRLSDLVSISKIADEAGVTLDDVEKVLMDKLSEIDALPDWAEKYRVRSTLAQTDDVVKAVDAKVRELQEQAYFMASEVDGIPPQLAEYLTERGFKLVYGVEFAQPLDLRDILPAFDDLTRRQLKQKSLGEFFSRQDPEVVTALKVRKVRDGLHARLARLPSEGGRALNLGSAPSTDNADLNMVVEDLFDILRKTQENARHTIEDLQDARVVEKLAGRAKLARIPFSLDRLPSDLGYKKFISEVTRKGYSEEQAIAMYHGLMSSQALGFRRHGLFAIESKLRSSPNLTNSLRFLGKVEDPSLAKRAVRGAVGAWGGHYAAGMMLEPGEENTDAGLLTRAAGTLVGGALGASGAGVPGLRAAADAIENSRYARWTYVADYAANIRDMVRFSLSPIFDASRYSEAIILSQIGEMPPGLRNLRVNQSPTAWRKAKAKELVKAGTDRVEARRTADVLWQRNLDLFAAQARGYKDFEWEVIDGVGRRFSSVGILGFSPADWMASTFGHIVDQVGVARAKEAYDTVREIYTYGTTGRSAAELSMNFVFFPFSFTKKTVGHLSKFFTDDLTRLIVLNDMAATYQYLDGQYNLAQEWRDRLPVLDKVHRLNLLAYGIGLGQFGGVNANAIQAFTKLPGVSDVVEGLPGPESIANAFIPQMVPMSSSDDGETAWEAARSLLPVINDVNTMIAMAVDQGYVVGSKEHLTSEAEQRRAWDEWRTFQTSLSDELAAVGLSWDQAVRRPAFGQMVRQEKAKISYKYPAWKFGLGDGIAHHAAIEMEMQERMVNPTSPGDPYLQQFQSMIDAAEAKLGVTFSGSPESIPPGWFELTRRMAIDFAKLEPEFLRLYNRFYRRIFGDITVDA